MLHHSHTAFGLRRYEQRHSSIPTTPAAKPISPSVACGLLLPVDLLMIVGSAAIAYVTRFAGEASAHWMDYGLVVAFGTLLSVNVFYLSGMYEARMVRHPRAAIRGIVLGWLAVAAFLMAAGFVTKTSEDYPVFGRSSGSVSDSPCCSPRGWCSTCASRIGPIRADCGATSRSSAKGDSRAA